MVIFSKPVQHLLHRSTQKSVLFMSTQTSTLFPVNRKAPNISINTKFFPPSCRNYVPICFIKVG